MLYLKDKSKIVKCRLLQFLFGALRVNVNITLLVDFFLQKILAGWLKDTAAQPTVYLHL